MLKKCAFLTDATHQAYLYCLQKKLQQLDEEQALGRKVQLQKQATQTPPKLLPEVEGD